MPGPLVSALAKIPWPLILKQGPSLLAAAEALVTNSRRRSVELTAAANDFQALRHRLSELEEHQQANAALVKQLTDQINAVTVAAQASAVRARQSLILGAAGVALGLVACLVALLR